jgi:hypothetical protein
MTFILVITGLVVIVVAYRFYKAKRDMKWSKGKGVVAYGPAPLGHHFIFVDENLDVAIFLPKSDGSLHVVTGTPVGAEYWRKYNERGQMVKEGKMEGVLEWKITKGGIYYRGEFLKSQGPPLKAEIHSVDELTSSVDSSFVDNKAKKLMEYMKDEGELPTRAR